MRTGIHNIVKELPLLLEDAKNELTLLARYAMAKLLDEHHRLTHEIVSFDTQLKELANQNAIVIKLMHLRGMGLLVL